MNKIISLVLVIVSLVLLLAPDYILSKDSENSVMQALYDYHQIIGGLILAVAYYLYSNVEHVSSEMEYDVTSVASSESRD